ARGALHQRGDLAPAVGTRDDAIERGRQRRGALRPVDAQVARGFVDLVLHAVEGRDLDPRGEAAGRLGAGLEAVPGMRPEALEGRPGHAGERSSRYACAARSPFAIRPRGDPCPTTRT